MVVLIKQIYITQIIFEIRSSYSNFLADFKTEDIEEKFLGLVFECYSNNHVDHVDRKITYQIVDKDKLTWAMLKYGFEVEFYSN